MKLTSFIRALSLFPAVANAIDGDRIAKTFEIMSYIVRDTADSAMEIFPPNSTVDYYYPNIGYGFSVLTAAVQNMVLLLAPETNFTTAATKRQSVTALPTDEQTQICSAAGLYVSIHLNLLDIMIGKRELLKSTQSTDNGKSNNGQFLTNLNAFDESIADLYHLIAPLVPTCLDDLIVARQSYDNTTHRMTRILTRITTGNGADL